MPTARCQIGVDHDFGPKRNARRRHRHQRAQRRSAPRACNGIEISHGWDPSGVAPDRQVAEQRDNRVIGNWIGFRGDGSYDADVPLRPEQPGQRRQRQRRSTSTTDRTTTWSRATTWRRSMTASRRCRSNTTGNIIRDNIIGESPLGQPAPLTRDGIVVATEHALAPHRGQHRPQRRPLRHRPDPDRTSCGCASRATSSPT